MGTDNGESIQYGYNFEIILNTFEMGHLKKTMFTHPVLNGPDSDPWDFIVIASTLTHYYLWIVALYKLHPTAELAHGCPLQTNFSMFIGTPLGGTTQDYTLLGIKYFL